MSEQLRIASWNVESIRSHLEQVRAWLAHFLPDVVALQETRCGARRFPTEAFAEIGYDVSVHGGDDGSGGVAVAAKHSLSITEIQRGLPGAVAPLDEPRSISFTAAGIRFHTAYAPNGGKVATPSHELKLAWLSLFRQWVAMERHDHERTVVLGDLNVAPTDLDVWEPLRYRRRNLTSPRERAAFQAFLDDGLVDVVRRHYGDAAVYTWWNRRADFYATDRGWRLDHVLADPVTASRVRSVSIDRAQRGRPGSSDHAPIVVDLDR